MGMWLLQCHLSTLCITFDGLAMSSAFARHRSVGQAVLARHPTAWGPASRPPQPAVVARIPGIPPSLPHIVQYAAGAGTVSSRGWAPHRSAPSSPLLSSEISRGICCTDSQISWQPCTTATPISFSERCEEFKVQWQRGDGGHNMYLVFPDCEILQLVCRGVGNSNRCQLLGLTGALHLRGGCFCEAKLRDLWIWVSPCCDKPVLKSLISFLLMPSWPAGRRTTSMRCGRRRFERLLFLCRRSIFGLLFKLLSVHGISETSMAWKVQPQESVAHIAAHRQVNAAKCKDHQINFSLQVPCMPVMRRIRHV